MELLEAIDKIEELAISGKKFPMSRKALVDPDELLRLVDQLRVAVPEDLSRAQEVLRKREDLLNQGLDEARKIRASAENEFRTKLDENSLVKESEKHAEDIIAQANEKAQRIIDAAHMESDKRRVAADQYSQEVLYQLEQDVAGVLTTIRHGIEVLDSRQSVNGSRH